jgi:predicted metal-dependent hydrolase
MLPDHLIDYVIVHELSHIRHKNHSKPFWHLVAQFAPNWKQDRKAIRAFELYLL